MIPHAALPRLESSQLKVVLAGSVIIRHPGLDKMLFRFSAYSGPDPTDSSKRLVGVYHRLVLDACRVITNHTAIDQSDFLAEDREGKSPVPLDDAKLLSPRDYFYFLGSASDPVNLKYPIVMSFSAFIFPPHIPNNWYTARLSGQLTGGQVSIASSTDMSAHVTSRDQYCAATKYRHFIRCAHLVPKAEAAWFMANEMFTYAPDNEDARVNAHTNGISLRDDVRRCLDSHAFVFYPAGSGQFMTYFVQAKGFPEYTELLHQRLATIHPSVAVEFLYARFAYTIIHLAGPKEIFDSVPDNPAVKMWEEALASEKAAKQARKASKLPIIDEDATMSEAPASEKSSVSGGNEDSDLQFSFASNRPTRCPPEESYAAGDIRWRERLFTRLPHIATLDEVEHPPDGVACHAETPHMLRLKSKYIKEHPQVWQTSMTPADATRSDSEGFLAEFMTRPT